ncbi:uncharacterized protein TNCV_1070641 [Trichonephila clavipes]|nr:uncharacterized protein TNCV_1070641 [Trichonephila clavipes]
MLGRRIAARPRSPAAVRDLEIALLEEWNSIPQSLIDNLIASMANRYPTTFGTVMQQCTLNLSRAERSSRWCGVVVRRGGQLRCRPRHLTMVQNYVVRRQKPSCS